MPTLVLETSTPVASLLLVHDDGSVSSRSFQSDRSHNAELFRPLAELMDGKPQLDLVLVGSGPGSYSGTRVGIAAAQGIAIAMGCAAAAVPSILALPSSVADRACIVIGDARRGSYWTASINDGALEGPPGLCDSEGLARIVAMAIDAGQPVLTMEETERFPLPENHRSEIRREVPSAHGIWAAWNQSSGEIRQLWLKEAPQPLYLKPPHITPAKRPWLVE